MSSSERFFRMGARCYGMTYRLRKSPRDGYAADQLRGLPRIAFHALEFSLNLPEVWPRALRPLRFGSLKADPEVDNRPKMDGPSCLMPMRDNNLWSLKLA